MKNGLLGKGIYRFFKKNHGLIPALFPEMATDERNRYLKYLHRQLNPNDEGARLSVREAEDLIFRIHRHGCDVTTYIRPALKRFEGSINHSSTPDQFNGFVDNDVLSAIRELSSPEKLKYCLAELKMDELYEIYISLHAGYEAVKNALAEVENELNAREER